MVPCIQADLMCHSDLVEQNVGLVSPVHAQFGIVAAMPDECLDGRQRVAINDSGPDFGRIRPDRTPKPRSNPGSVRPTLALMMPPWLKPATTVCAGAIAYISCTCAIKVASSWRLASAASRSGRGPCGPNDTWNQPYWFVPKVRGHGPG